MAEKKTHQEVNYRAGTLQRHCGRCTMYRNGGHCTDVKDPISPRGDCNIYQGFDHKGPARLPLGHTLRRK